MGIEIVPTGACAGAQIRGVDLTQPIDESTFAAIERAFDTHGVIFFRDQHISPQQQVELSRRFGELQINVFSERWGIPECPEIVVLSNITKDGKPTGVRRAGDRWHSDMSYTARPPRGTMLRAIEVPVLEGLPLGDTMFANAAAAWEALPASMRERIDALQGVFDFSARKRGYAVTDDEKKRFPPVRHPIVRTHARTGRKSLYVMRDDCTGIVGMEQAEAQALIEALADHIVRPEFVYRHRWRSGDVLLWDNCTVQHQAVLDYDLPQRRLMHRTTMGVSVPA